MRVLAKKYLMVVKKIPYSCEKRGDSFYVLIENYLQGTFIK